MTKFDAGNAVIWIGTSLIVACAFYIVNLWLFSSNQSVSPADASFMEGMLMIVLGILVCLGSGGISRTSHKAAMLSAAASATGAEVIGPAEIFRKDAWKPKGFVKLGLTLIVTGIILLIIYFISL
jgi:hypothetical protein